MDHVTEKTIGQMVADNYRTAQVFKKHKIDFCCKGNRTLSEVATKKGLNLEILLQELDTVQAHGQGDHLEVASWPLDLLADYIEKKHHRYVEQQIPILNQYLDKLCRVHGDRHPELFEISELFKASGGELAMHMKKEELVLFPWVRKMVEGIADREPLVRPHFGTVRNPIQMMMKEYDQEGERFRKIAELTNSYTPPADACNTYRVTYSLLQEFEEDLHRHIHLENNVLFPKAETLEQQTVH